MRDSDKREKNKTYAKLIESAVIMLICLAVLLYWSFSWFSMNKIVTSNGMSIDVAGPAEFKVTAKCDTDDEVLTVADVTTNEQGERLFRIRADNNISLIAPGSNGKFSFWISSDNASSVLVKPSVKAGGILTERDEEGNITGITTLTGYRENTSAEEQLKASEYLQGHIILFRNYDNNTGQYSGWLNPSDDNLLTLTHTDGTKNEFTLYWVWIDSYSKFYTDSVISQNDLDAISALNFTDGIVNDYGSKHLFDTRKNQIVSGLSNTVLAHYYDFGDEDIGTAISHIYFDLAFS